MTHTKKETRLSDITTEVKAILGRTLHDLEQVIDNTGVKSLLRSLHGMLGVEDHAASASKPVPRRTTRAKPKQVPASRAATARVASPPQEKGVQARARTSVKPRAASSARARSGAGPAGRNGRREQLLALVVDQPGITVTQAAKQFGLKDGTGLYPVARRLQDEGLVLKHGVELHPTAKAQRTR